MFVAGHIKPGAHCTSWEPSDYPNVASLGAALCLSTLSPFDDSGAIVDGRPIAVEAVARARAELVGKCETSTARATGNTL